ncbi:MAG TPA: histidine kinase dimerization/phospho-acceptor domain-containing protein, partial [Nitrososphaeraceae archaeon]|nr:histidine kinase dimerization/phospho-acceptor domain-containing protein [Nitrososphaeraceae archaeon]
MKVRARLFAIIFSLVLASLISASLASLNAFSTGLILEVSKHLEHDSVNWMDEISRAQHEKIRDLSFLSTQISNILRSNLTDEQKDAFLIDFQGSLNSNTSLFVYDRNGNEILGTSKLPVGDNVSAYTSSKESILGKINEEILPAFYPNGSDWLKISTPIRGNGGIIGGYVALYYPLVTLVGNNVSSLEPNLRFDLISKNGTILYSNAGVNTRDSTNFYHDQPIFMKITNSTKSVENGIFPNLDTSGGDSIFIAVKQRSFPDYQGDGMFLITAVVTDKAFGGVLDLRTIFIIITVLILAISTLVVFFVARSISKPITELDNAARRITKGDFAAPVEIRTSDEIGELAQRFDEMRKSITTRTEEILKKDAELNEAYKSLIESDKSKDEFISMISHELKTPIVPIKLYSDMLLKTEFMGNLNEKQTKAIETMKKSVEKIEVLVSDMLDIHKLEIERLRLSKTNIDVREIIDQAISEMLPLGKTKNVNLVSEISVTGTVYCDPKRIGQVICNLIKNSIDFVPENGGKI